MTTQYIVWELPGVPPGGTLKMPTNCRTGRRAFWTARFGCPKRAIVVKFKMFSGPVQLGRVAGLILGVRAGGASGGRPGHTGWSALGPPFVTPCRDARRHSFCSGGPPESHFLTVLAGGASGQRSGHQFEQEIMQLG